MESYNENLQDILKKAQNLSVELEGSSNIPKINRSIFQILEEGQNFLKRHKSAANESDIFKASLLLGEKGYTVPDAHFETFKEQIPSAIYEPTSDIDVETFIKNEKENDLINLLESSKKLSEQKCDEYCERVIQSDWENEKRKLLLELGTFSPNMTGPLQKLNISKSTQPSQRSYLKQDFSATIPNNTTLLSTTIGYSGVPSCLDALESAQAAQLIVYNAKMSNSIQNTMDRNASNCELFNAWAQCAQMYGDEDVREMWSLVCNTITRPNRSGKSARVYRGTPQFQARHVATTRKYLENIYLDYLRAQLEPSDPMGRFATGPEVSKMAADLGPNYQVIWRTCNRLLATGQVDYQVEGGTMDRVPVWMMIYNLARTGQYKTALGYGKTIRHVIGDSVYVALQEAADVRETSPDDVGDEVSCDVSDDVGTTLESEYKKMVKYSADPYKKACYCILGKLNFEETFSEIVTKTDDYLWFKLCIVKPDPSEPVPQSAPAKSERVLLFSELQTSLLKQYGPEYFKADEKPWLYFRILACVAQFESAIQFLASGPTQPRDGGSRDVRAALLGQATCFAIALYQANLLQVTAKVEDDLVTENKASLGPSFNLNLSRLVSLYVRRFEAVDTEEALNYYYVLRNVKASPETFKDGDFKENSVPDMYVTNAARLIVETKNFDSLIGTLSTKEGIKIKDGIVDKLGTDVKAIIKMAATEFENKALYPQAIYLYQISKDYSRLFTLLRSLLAGLLGNPSAASLTSSTSTGLLSLADTVAQRYMEGNGGQKSSMATQLYPTEAGNVFILLDMCKFFQSYLAQNYEEALYIVEQLRLVPFERSDVSYCVQNFSSLRDEVRNVMPDILVAVMTMLARKYKECKGGNGPPLPWSADESLHAAAAAAAPGFLMNRSTATLSPDQSYATERAKMLQDLKGKANLLMSYPSLLPYRFTGDTNGKLVQLSQSMI